MSSLADSYFVCGILTINNSIQHSIFNIDLKRKFVKGETIRQIYTCDLPPVAVLSPNHVYKITFQIENNIDITTPIVHILGNDELHTNQIKPNLRGEQCAIKTYISEWQFKRNITDSSDPNVWYLTEIKMFVPEVNLKQYLF